MPLAGQIIRALDFPPVVQVQDDTDVLNISSTTATAGSPECSTTFMANTAGKATVELFARVATDGTNRIFVGFEVRENNASGTVVEPAADNQSVQGIPTVPTTMSMPFLVEGLDPGGTYFVRTMHRVAGGAANDIFDRRIVVTPAT